MKTLKTFVMTMTAVALLGAMFAGLAMIGYTALIGGPSRERA